MPLPSFFRILSRLPWRPLCAGLLAVFGLPACKREAASPIGTAQAGPAAVTVARPIARRLTDWDEFTGRLTSRERVEVRARVSGYVNKVSFKEGTEVKAVRLGRAQISESYGRILKGELWLFNAHIDEYAFGSYLNHAVRRDRKLLLHKTELRKIFKAVEVEGRVVFPLRMYFKEALVKVVTEQVCRQLGISAA
jgi:hypothetical protein